METQHVTLFKRLIKKAKEFSLFDDYWGKHVLISEVVGYDSPPGDIGRLQKEAKNHTCFQVSMTCMQLYGILDIDAAVPYTLAEEGREEGGKLSLRTILPRHFRTRDNKSPLFAEVHQRQHGAAVEVVIPNTKEADAMLGDINRHVPAFLKYYLVEKGLKEDFVTRLVVAACCPSEVARLNGTTWDSANLKVITPEDAKDKESLAAFADQDWYFDLQKLRVSPNKKKSLLDYTSPEALFNLDAERSVVTLHAKNDTKRAAARNGYGEASSEEEDEDSASDERELDKSPDGKAIDTEEGDGNKSISWSPSNPSDGRLSSHAAAGGG
jgi:hypothetical protein